MSEIVAASRGRKERNTEFFQTSERSPDNEEAPWKNLKRVQRAFVRARGMRKGLRGGRGWKEARVRQIREEYIRRSQSFAVRLRETTVYSRVKSHTRSWISAKCLYYRNIAPVSHPGCHTVNFSRIEIAKQPRPRASTLSMGFISLYYSREEYTHEPR